MKNISAIAIMLLLMTYSHAQGAILFGPQQWEVGNGGNGHFYMLVLPDSPQTADDNFSWFEARDAAAASTYNRSFGHLVTITSFGEDEFLRTTFEDEIQIRDFPSSPGDFVWIGLTDQNVEGSFQWITGEPLAYTNWASTEPNNLGDEDFVHIWRRFEGSNQDGWSWNDKLAGPFLPDSRWGYIVEYDGPFDAAVPEPTSMVIWVVVAGGFGLLRARRQVLARQL